MLKYRHKSVMMEEYALEYINHEVLCKRSTYRADKYKYLLAYQELAKKLAIPLLHARALERQFRKYFFTKMKAMVCKGLTDISQMPEEPRWMRLVEEKLNTLPTLLQDLNRRRQTKGTSPDEVVSALCTQATLRGTLCARDVYRSVARDLRLSARVSELHAAWVSAQRVSLRFLSISSRAGDAQDSAPSLSHAQVADLVLLHTDVNTLHLVTDESDNIEAESKALAVLWRLVQRHRVEERAPPRSRVRAQRWTRVYHDYLASNRLATLVVLQRRWHELKLRARTRALAAHAHRHALRHAHGHAHGHAHVHAPHAHAPPLTDLDVAILKKYPHIVTSPLASWLTLVRRGSIITQLLADAESDQDSDECDEQVFPEDAAKPTAKLDPKQGNNPSQTKPAVNVGHDAVVSGRKDIPYNEKRDITDVLRTVDPCKVTVEVFIESDTENEISDAVYKSENGPYDEDSKAVICVKEEPRTMANRIVFANDNDITIQEIDDEIIEGNFDTKLLMDSCIKLTRVQDTRAWRQYSKEDKYINASYFTIDDVSIKRETEDVDSYVTESKMAIIFEDDSDVVDSDYDDPVPVKIPRLNSAGEPQESCPDLQSLNAGQNSDVGQQKSGKTQAQKIRNNSEVMDSDDVSTIANKEIISMPDLEMLLAELPTARKVEQVPTSGNEHCCPARKHVESCDHRQSLGLPPLLPHSHDNGPCTCCCGNIREQSAQEQANVDLKALKNDITDILKVSVMRKEKRAQLKQPNPRPPRKKPNKTVKKNNETSSTEGTAVTPVAATVPKTTESFANTTLTDKTKSQSTKNPALEGAKKASTPSLEGYDEWIRQKNVNTQFFILQGVNKKDKAKTDTIPTEVTPASENTSYKSLKSTKNPTLEEAKKASTTSIEDYDEWIRQKNVNTQFFLLQGVNRKNKAKTATMSTEVTPAPENTSYKSPKSTKNSTLQEAKKASTSSLEGCDKWIRQKNVNTQFFLLQGVNKKVEAKTAIIPTGVTPVPENTSYKPPKSYLRLSSQENDAKVLQKKAQHFGVNIMPNNARTQQFEGNKIQNNTITQQFEVNNIQSNAITQNNEENRHRNQILQKLYTHVMNRIDEQGDKVIISNKRDEQDDLIIISDEDSREEKAELTEEIQGPAKETQALAKETQALEEETQAPAEVTQALTEETAAPYTSESFFSEVYAATNKLIEFNNAYKNAFEVPPTANMQSLMTPNIIDTRGEALSINRKEVFSTSKQTQKNIVLMAPTISRKPVCQAPTTYNKSERPRQEPFYQDAISSQSGTNNGRNPNLKVLPDTVPKPADEQISPNELDYPRVVPFIQWESNNAQRSCKMCTLPGDQIREPLALPERTGGQSASTTSDNPIPPQLNQPETTASNQSSLICSTKSGDSIVTPNVQPAPISGQTPPTTLTNPMPVLLIRQETSNEKNCSENYNRTSGNLITPSVLPEPTIGQTISTKLPRMPFIRRDIIGQRTSSIRNPSGNQYMAPLIQPEPMSGQIAPIERNSSIPVPCKRPYSIGPRTLLIRSTSNNRIITPLIPPEPTSGQTASVELNESIPELFYQREDFGPRTSSIRSSTSVNRFTAPSMQPEPTSGQTGLIESHNSIVVPFNRRDNITGHRRSLIRSSTSSNRFMTPLMQPEPTSGQTAPTEWNNSILVPSNRRENIIGPRMSVIRSTTSGNVYTRPAMLPQCIGGQTASTEYNNRLPASVPLIWRETILGQECSSINSSSSENKDIPPMQSKTIGEQTYLTESNNSTRVPFIQRENIIELKSSSIRSTPSGNLFMLPPETTSEPITPTKSNNPIPMHNIRRDTTPGKKTFKPSTNNPIVLQETTDTISNNSLVPASISVLMSPTNHSVNSNTGTVASVNPPKVISERNVATDCRTNLDEPESISMQNDLTNNGPESNTVPPRIDMLQNSNVELQSPNECATKSKPSIPSSKSIKILSSITLNQNIGPRSPLNKPSSSRINTQSSMNKDERKSDKESPTRAKGVVDVNKSALNKIIIPKEARSSKSKTKSSAVSLLYNDADTIEADNSVQHTITLNSNNSNYDEEHDEWLKHKNVNKQFFKPPGTPMEDIIVTMKTKKRKHHDKIKKKSKRKEKIKKHKHKKYKHDKETTEVMTDIDTLVESDTVILDASVENQMSSLREKPLPSEEIESETPMHNALVKNKTSCQEKTPHREMQLRFDRLQIKRKISVHDTISSSDDGATPSKIQRPNSDCKIFSFCPNEPSVHNETILHDIQDNHKIEAERLINNLQVASAETDHNSMDCSEILLHTKTDSRKIQLDSQSDRKLVSNDLPFCSETSHYNQISLHEAYQREMIYNARCLNDLPLLLLPPPFPPPPLPASPSPQDAQELAETLEECAPLGKTEACLAEINNNTPQLTPITNNTYFMVDKYSNNNETNESLTELTPTYPLHIDISAPNNSQVVLRDYSDHEDNTEPPQLQHINIPSVTIAEGLEDSVFTTDDLYQKPSSDLSHHRLSTEYQIPTVIVGEYPNAKSNAVLSPKALRQSKTLVQNSLYIQIPRENIKHSTKYKHKTFEQSDAHFRRERNFSTMLSPDRLRQTHIDVQIVGQYPSKPPKKRPYQHTIVSEQNEPITSTDPENNSDRITLENNDGQSETLNSSGERNDSVPELHIAPPGVASAQTLLPKKDIRLSKDLDNRAECVKSKDDYLADKATNMDSPICTSPKDYFTLNSRHYLLEGTTNTIYPKYINFNTMSVLPKDEDSDVIGNLASSSGHVTPKEHLNTVFPKDMRSPISENNNNDFTNYSAYSTNFNVTQKIHTDVSSDSEFSTPLAKDLCWLKEINLTKVPVERNRRNVRKVQRRIADGIRKSTIYMIPSSSPGKNNIINAPQTDANVPQSIDFVEQADMALLDPVRLIIPPTKSETHQSDIAKSNSSTNVNKSRKRKRNCRILRKASQMCSPNQTGPSSETSGKLLKDVSVIPDAIVAEIKKTNKLKPEFNTKVSTKVYTARHKCKEQKRYSFQSLSPVDQNKAVEMSVAKFKLRKDWYNNVLSKPTGSKLKSVPNLVYPFLSMLLSPPFSKNHNQSNEDSLDQPPKLCISNNLQSSLIAGSAVSEESTENSIEERQLFDASREEFSLESPKLTLDISPERTHTENVVTSTLSQHTPEIDETEKSEVSHKMVDETGKIDTPTTSFLLPTNAEELVQQNEARSARVTPRDDSSNNGKVYMATLTECNNIEADFIGEKRNLPHQCKEQHYVKRTAKQIQKNKRTKKQTNIQRQTTLEEKVKPTTKINYKNLPIRKRPYIQPEQSATKIKANAKREITKPIRAQSTVARQSQKKNADRVLRVKPRHVKIPSSQYDQYIRMNHRKQDTLRMRPLGGTRLKNLYPVATTSLAEVPSMDEVGKTLKRLPSVEGTSEWYSEIRTLVESPALPKLRIRVVQKSAINQTEETTTGPITEEVVAQPDDTTLMNDVEIYEIPLPEVEPPAIDVSLNDIPLPIEQPPVEVILLSCVGPQDSDTLVSKIPKIDMECVADVLSNESQSAQSPNSLSSVHRTDQQHPRSPNLTEE